MKKIKLLLLSLLVLPCLVLLTSCGNTPEPTALNASLVTLSEESVAYSGEAITPTVTVTVNNSVVSAENYSVEYLNNINVGVASVKVVAQPNNKIISGEVTKTFEITRSDVVVNNFNELKSALNNDNYKFATITLGANITIEQNEELTIAQDYFVDFASFSVTNNGSLIINGKINTTSNILGTGLVTNNGEIVANVANLTALTDAFEYANKIVLTNDIVDVYHNGAYCDINVTSISKNYNFTLDINGHILGGSLAFRNVSSSKPITYSDYGFDVTIIDSSANKTGLIGSEDPNCWYALNVLGNEKVKVTANGVKFVGYWGGFASQGNCAGATVIATNCSFSSVEQSSGVGAYLPANYTYNFTSCSFEGITGYYTKSGTHTLTNCVVKGTGDYASPTHNGSGAEPTGSAFVCDSATGYQQPINITITGGNYISAHGYGIEEYSTASAGTDKVSYAQITYDSAVSFEVAEKENVISENNVLSLVNA